MSEQQPEPQFCASSWLKDIHERTEMATPGPWQAHTFTEERILIAPWPPHTMENGDTVCLNVAHTPFLEHIPMLAGLRSREQTHADAAFIAHAREDIPALLAEIARLEKILTDEHDGFHCDRCGRVFPFDNGVTTDGGKDLCHPCCDDLDREEAANV